MTAARQVAQGMWPGASGETSLKAAATAAGTTQATALAITTEYTELGTVAAGSGVGLPGNAITPGDRFTVANFGANAALVYPPVGGFVGVGAVNVGFSVAAGKVATFIASITPGKFAALLSA